MLQIHNERILILDFGSQYTQLIARRVREIGVYSEVHSFDMSEADIATFKPSGIILSGGPETVTTTSTPRAPANVFTIGCPVLGICYGMQTMAAQLGGEVTASGLREFGHADVNLTVDSSLLQGLADRTTEQGNPVLHVWMSHGDKVTRLPEGFVTIACTLNAPIAAMADEQRHFYGIQFHPEVVHTPQGMRILTKFIRDICKLACVWTPANVIEDEIEKLRAQIGQEHVILGLSGGVDSAVAAALLHRAIGKQLIAVFVDTGLLRLNEAEEVKTTFEQHLGLQLIVVDARQRFMQALKGITDPEQKRKIIGKLFIDVFAEEAKKFPEVKWLAQGTIYSDVIESAASALGKAHVIKSHHNVGGLPEKLPLKLVEPLRELFKDEVRKIGLSLGLPSTLILRHPFPGPGLGVRILEEVTEARADLLRAADAIFIEELRKQGWYDKVNQAFAVFLPVCSVGVVGDARQYEPVVSLRAVETVDFMTARWAHLPYSLLETVSNRIINEVKGISRVTYDISSKPPATIEWE